MKNKLQLIEAQLCSQYRDLCCNWHRKYPGMVTRQLPRHGWQHMFKYNPPHSWAEVRFFYGWYKEPQDPQKVPPTPGRAWALTVFYQAGQKVAHHAVRVSNWQLLLPFLINGLRHPPTTPLPYPYSPTELVVIDGELVDSGFPLS